MSSPASRPPREWPGSSEFNHPTPLRKRILHHRLTGLAAIFLFGLFIYASNGAPWMKRLTMCMLFCGLIYVRDDSPSGRWLAIGIIVVGTLLAILLPLFSLDVDGLRHSF